MMAEAETENQALDVEALTGILRGRAIRQTFPLGPSILITMAERDAIIAALERAEDLESVRTAALRTDWLWAAKEDGTKQWLDFMSEFDEAMDNLAAALAPAPA